MRACSICHAHIGPNGECGCGSPLVSKAEWEASFGSEMSETLTLQERLRAVDGKGDAYGNGPRLRNPDGPEAADALEAAEARIAELEAERNGLREALYVYGDRKKMGPVLLSALEQYAAAREIVLRDEGGEG